MRDTAAPPSPRSGPARLHSPRLAYDLVPRTDLLERWNAADPDVTLIHGPAGYGKTCLVQEYVAELADDTVAVGWLTLDPMDNVPDTFVRHLAQALADRVPGMRPDRLADVLEPLDAHGDRAADYAATVLVDILSTIQDRVVLVLDDCHHLSDPPVLALASRIINHSAHAVQFVLTSRWRPGLALSSLRLRGRLHEIDEHSLRFAPDEAAALLDADLVATPAATGTTGTAETTDLPSVHEGLIAYANGWAAALRMMSVSLSAGTPAADLLLRMQGGAAGDLGDFLAENVVDTLDEDLLRFLEAVAVCDRVCASLAGELTGRTDAQHLLDEAVRRSLFVSPAADDASWFVMHRAFRDFLTHRLRSTEPDRLRALHLRAAQWCAQHDQYDAAVDHALQVSPQAATDLLEKHAMEFIESSHMAALVRLADRLPQREKQASWRLMLAVTWANALLQRAVVAQVHLDHARAALPEAEATAEVLAEMNVVQACIDIFRDHHDRIPDLVTDAMDERFRPFVLAVAGNARTVAHLQRGEFAAARRRQAWTEQFHLRTQGPFAGVYGRAFSGLAALEQLDLQAALVIFDEAVQLAAEGSGRSSHAAQLARGLRGELAMEMGAADDAIGMLTDALSLGAEGGTVEVTRVIFGTLARAWHQAGDVELALDLLAEGMGHAARLDLPRLQAELLLEQARIQLERPDLTHARVQEKTLEELTVRAGQRPRSGIGVPTTLARALLAGSRGHHAQAISLLDDVVNHPRLSPRRRLLAQAQLCAALERAGRPRQAAALLTDIVSVAAPHHAVGSFRAAGSALQPVITRRLQSPDADRPEREFLTDLLSTPAASATPPPPRRVLGPADQPPAAPEETERLNEREEQILTYLEQGLTNQDIGARMFLSVNTVKWHLKNIYRKLGATSRLAAVTAFRERRLGLAARP